MSKKKTYVVELTEVLPRRYSAVVEAENEHEAISKAKEVIISRWAAFEPLDGRAALMNNWVL